MTSIHHDGAIEVIRTHPVLTADLVRRVTPVKIPSQDRIRVELGSVDASNVVPDEFKADMVTVIRDRCSNDPLLLVIVEPQGRADKAKKFSWPAYIANLRAAHECEAAVLIVVCWDAAEAAKCRRAISLGHPGFVLVPVVIGPRDGENLDGGNPWLRILSGSMGAIDLDAEAGRRAVLDAIRDTRSDVPVTRTLTAIILGVASDAARTELVGSAVQRGPEPIESAGLFRTASLQTRRAPFNAPGFPAIYAACATGFAWMCSWQSAQTMRVLRRFFAMRTAHAG